MSADELGNPSRGLDALRNLAERQEACCFYETEEDRCAVLVSFLREGQEQRQRGFLVTDIQRSQAAAQSLQEKGLQPDRFRAGRELSIIVYESFMYRGVFDQDRMIAMLKAQIDRTRSEGCTELRFLMEMDPLIKYLSSSFHWIEYLGKVHQIFGVNRCSSIDFYDCRSFDPELLKDLMFAYSTVIIGTEAYMNSCHVPSLDLLGLNRSETELTSCMKKLLQQNQGDKTLRKSQQMLQLALDNIRQAVFWKDRNSVYLGCNKAFAPICGIDDPADIVGKSDCDFPWSWEKINFCLECDRRVMETDTPEYHIIETELQAGGKQVWIETNKIPLHDNAGNVEGILGTCEDITELKRLEEEKLEITLRERESIGWEIHDDLGQRLTGIGLIAEGLNKKLKSKKLPEAIEARKIVDELRHVNERAHMLVQGLCAGEVGANELQKMLMRLAKEIQDVSGLQCTFRSNDIRVGDDQIATHLYRICQEATNNAVKHGNATNISISLSRSKNMLRLRVEDDGVGCTPEQMISHPSGGLCIMTSRAKAIGAMLKVTGTPGKGTVVLCSLVE